MVAMIEPSNSVLVKFGITEQEIAETREKYAALEAETREGYEQTRLAIAEVRGLRTKIENRRVELKADALAWGKLVDSTAKQLTAFLLEIEEPLKAKKAIVDERKEAEKRAKAEAERKAMEEKIRAEREAEESRLRAIREEEEAKAKAERERIAAEQEAERKRLAAIKEATERR